MAAYPVSGLWTDVLTCTAAGVAHPRALAASSERGAAGVLKVVGADAA